jgi:hypothetical protein
MPSARSLPWRGLSVALLPVVMLLAGCSGTRFGDLLSRSFSAPPSPAPLQPGRTAVTGGASGPSPSAGAIDGAGAPQPAPPAGASTPAAGSSTPPGGVSRTAAPTVQNRAGPVAPTASAPVASPETSASGTRPSTARPAPYRVTILLPQADAAAPAEVVTQALRAAGVPFEVETIERIGGGPAAVPGAAAAPRARPAPEPR